MIENILILDTETTGLDPRKGCKVIEIGVVLFNIPNKAILQCFSTLLPCEDNPVENINHIPAKVSQCKYPYDLNKLDLEEIQSDPDYEEVFLFDEEPRYFMDDIIYQMVECADAIVAHNAQFDRTFAETLPCWDVLPDKQWICTKKNFTWPVHLPRLRLEDICNAMGVPYVQAHRALSDCLLLAQCFQKVHDLEERFARL